MNHVDLTSGDPAAYRRLIDLGKQADAGVAAAGLDPLLPELVKIRVSQLNGCAFCLRMHTRDALALGETTDRLAVLSAWRESQYFSDVERAALRLAEAVTSPAAPPPATAEPDPLDARQAAAVGWLAVVMNAWNRVALTSGYPVAPAQGPTTAS
ncbi:carboxymuconolactone decarboxylase family protein [Streptomyces lonarensis]|uniref:Carboxymuconolactone decarboxylase family protein n=1 Tax=Streptomyces lonarensis TaxID=700599 RepID=A0A7X6D4J0_9ACTN|nr:carboxymuconolactone decarboxylase family protein [Streptomyces lonarensis]NJQ07838.1 carboxymuconolactone decarboxylase family protein [Streptomyces lonarensis]